MPLTCALSSVSPVGTVTATGVDCRLSEVFRAVTTISSMPTLSFADRSVSACANAGADASIVAPNMTPDNNDCLKFLIIVPPNILICLWCC
jgi:hypothetical protein